MKHLLLVISVLLLTSVAEAGVVYEKVSDGIFTKTVTAETVTSDNHTITSLREEITHLENDNITALNDYNGRVERNNNRIVELETDIVEAKKVGCVEITKDLDIITN